MRFRSLLLMLTLALAVLICAGCDGFHDAIFEEENADIPEEEYDPDRFFVKEEKEPECSS